MEIISWSFVDSKLQDIFKIDNNQTFEISIPEQINCKIISNSRKNSKIYERILKSINGNTSFIEFE